MRINANKFGLAAAISFALLWIVCSLIVMIIPHQSMRIAGAMMHAEKGQWQWDMHFGVLLPGLIIWSVLAGVTGWSIATIYNRLLIGESDE